MIAAADMNIQLLVMWLTYTVLALGGVMAIFIWGVRSRQFANQDRARYLALQAGIPEDAAPGDNEQSGKERPEAEGRRP